MSNRRTALGLHVVDLHRQMSIHDDSKPDRDLRADGVVTLSKFGSLKVGLADDACMVPGWPGWGLGPLGSIFYNIFIRPILSSSIMRTRCS